MFVAYFEVVGYLIKWSLISKNGVVTSKTGTPMYLFQKFQYAANNEGNPFEAFCQTDVFNNYNHFCKQHKLCTF